MEPPKPGIYKRFDPNAYGNPLAKAQAQGIQGSVSEKRQSTESSTDSTPLIRNSGFTDQADDAVKSSNVEQNQHVSANVKTSITRNNRIPKIKICPNVSSFGPATHTESRSSLPLDNGKHYKFEKIETVVQTATQIAPSRPQFSHERFDHAGNNVAAAEYPVKELSMEQALAQAQKAALKSIALRNRGRDFRATTSLRDLEIARRPYAKRNVSDQTTSPTSTLTPSSGGDRSPLPPDDVSRTRSQLGRHEQRNARSENIDQTYMVNETDKRDKEIQNDRCVVTAETPSGMISEPPIVKKSPYSHWSEAFGSGNGLFDWHGRMIAPPPDWSERSRSGPVHYSAKDTLDRWASEVDQLTNVEGENTTGENENVLSPGGDDWGKLDMSDPANIAIKNETTEDLVQNWNHQKEVQQLSDSQSLVPQEGLRALYEYKPEPNLNRSLIDIYLRPACSADIIQMTAIYNWYIKNTARTAEISFVSEDDMQDRLEDVRASKLPFVVAVDRKSVQKARSQLAGPLEKRENTQERIVGWGCAQDFTASDYAERISAEVEVYIEPSHRQLGIGRCILDQLLDACDRGYLRRGGYEFRCPLEIRHLYNTGGGRDLHKLIIIVRKWKFPRQADSPSGVKVKYAQVNPNRKQDDMENDYDLWLKAWLEGWGFEVEGMLKGVGAKHGRFIDEVYLGRETRWQPAEGRIPNPLPIL